MGYDVDLSSHPVRNGSRPNELLVNTMMTLPKHNITNHKASRCAVHYYWWFHTNYWSAIKRVYRPSVLTVGGVHEKKQWSQYIGEPHDAGYSLRHRFLDSFRGRNATMQGLIKQATCEYPIFLGFAFFGVGATRAYGQWVWCRTPDTKRLSKIKIDAPVPCFFHIICMCNMTL